MFVRKDFHLKKNLSEADIAIEMSHDCSRTQNVKFIQKDFSLKIKNHNEAYIACPGVHPVPKV